MEQEGRRGGVLGKVLLLTAALWVFYYVISLAPAFLVPPDRAPSVVRILGARFAGIAAGFLLCMAIYLAVNRLNRVRFSRQIGAVLLIAFPTGELFLTLERWTLGTASSGRFPPVLPSLDPFIHLQRTLFWTYFFLAWAVAVIALLYSERATREERLRAEAQVLAHRAQLRSLRYQLNPHFLFNTLNSIAALVLDRRNEAAELMLRRLSTFLRGGLAVDPMEEIPLAQEIAQQELYLEIERVRFPDRLAFDVEVPEEAETVLVPSLILQPLVENVVKYAVAPSRRVVTLRIVAKTEAERLSVTVQDDGTPERRVESGTRLGLENVRNRLNALYGEAAAFSAGPLEPRGFAATVCIPIRHRGG